MVFFCMAPRPPASPRTYAPVPHPTLFRSGASVDLAAAWSAVPDDVERLARRVPQHVVSAVAVEVADHRVEALAVDNHRHGGDGRTAVPDAVRGGARSVPEAVAAAVTVELAGGRHVVATPRHRPVPAQSVVAAPPEHTPTAHGTASVAT